jgi:hypothetical protein
MTVASGKWHLIETVCSTVVSEEQIVEHSLKTLWVAISNTRGVVPWGAGNAMAPPDFGGSVNPMSTRRGRLWLLHYYWHPRIFRPSYGPEHFGFEHRAGAHRKASSKLALKAKGGGRKWGIMIGASVLQFSIHSTSSMCLQYGSVLHTHTYTSYAI